MSVTFTGFRPGPPVTVDCLEKLNLLGHAQLEELDIGSQCGGHGVCGGDRLLIVAGSEGLSPLTAAEREHLSTAEIASGMRLGCQCFPASDGLTVLVRSPGAGAP